MAAKAKRTKRNRFIVELMVKQIDQHRRDLKRTRIAALAEQGFYWMNGQKFYNKNLL